MNDLYSDYKFIRELSRDYSLYSCRMYHKYCYYVVLDRDGKVVKSRENRSDNDKLILIKEWESDIRKQATRKAHDDSEMRKIFQNYNDRIVRKFYGKKLSDDFCVRAGGKVHVV